MAAQKTHVPVRVPRVKPKLLCPTCKTPRHKTRGADLECARQSWRVAVRRLGYEQKMREVTEDRLRDAEATVRSQRENAPVLEFAFTTINCRRCGEALRAKVDWSDGEAGAVRVFAPRHKCARIPVVEGAV